MKKRIISGAILFVVFIAALIGFSFMLNKGADDITADMGSASLPIISFKEADYTINELPGYTESMDMTTMRDVVVPVSVGTSVKANITEYSGKIDSAVYEVFSLDGKKSLKKKTIKNVKDTLNIELGDTISDGKEKVLRIKLNLGNKQEVYYYTRVIRAVEFNAQPCLEFAEDFHRKTLQKEDAKTALKPFLPRIRTKKGTLQEVTLESDVEQISWGSLSPEVVGDIRWQIKESTETYTSIYLKYQVKCKEESYNVTEFFKVRFLKGKASLEDYKRTMSQLFPGTEKGFDKKGIILGITNENVPYLANEDGDIVSFVQERELWNYNKKDDEVSLVFSFADAENSDVRNYNDSHDVRLLDMDKKGNTTFAVYGYMNRGIHEGQVGAAIYYFDIAKNYVEEKAFIPGNKSGEMTKMDLNQLVYYSKSKNMLYVMLDGSLYQIDLETMEKETLVENLEEGQYVVSKDSKYLAYQTNGKITEANHMTVWNLKAGKSYEVKAGKEEVVRPLGFVLGDIIYGIGNRADIGKSVSGETTIPLYKLEIRNEKNEVAKTYQADQTYVVDVGIENNMVTLERVHKNGGSYAKTSSDYITNNKEQEKQTIKAETYLPEENSELLVRLADEKKIENTKPKLLKPKQKLYERPTTIEFGKVENKGGYYVYGHGKLQGIYDKAGEAIVAADAVRGVVVTSKQTKVWERGNRQLRYQLNGAPAFTVNGGESSLAACIREILAYEGKNIDVAGEMANGKSALDILDEYSGGEGVDLTGCSLEQLYYIIGKGTPVIAMTGGNSAIMIVGYDDATVTYINPVTGKKPREAVSSVEGKLQGSRGTFIGYVK